jgi:hypothetical protein
MHEPGLLKFEPGFGVKIVETVLNGRLDIG